MRIRTPSAISSGRSRIALANSTVEKTLIVSLRGVRGGDAGCGARRSNLDLRSFDAARRLLRRHCPSPLSPTLTPRNDNSEVCQQSQWSAIRSAPPALPKKPVPVEVLGSLSGPERVYPTLMRPWEVPEVSLRLRVRCRSEASILSGFSLAE
jgi:hypothetical protein